MSTSTFKKFQRAALVVSVTFIFVVFVAFLLSACSTSFPAPHNTIGHTFHKPTPVVVTTPQQPMTAAQAAALSHCGRFVHKPFNPAKTMYTIDGGSCWKNGQKYGINTFVTKTGRDNWIKLAQASGVGLIPKWETPTSVIYPSISS
jgi:hypothetical protein